MFGNGRCIPFIKKKISNSILILCYNKHFIDGKIKKNSVCTDCGSSIESDSLYCSNCGKKINKDLP